jgi:hypothetical protein
VANLAEIRSLSDDDLVARHDALAGDGTDMDERALMRDVMRIRALEHQTEVLERLVVTLWAMTAVGIVLTAVVLVIAT